MNINNFWSKINKTETCWNWTGATRKGYGAIRMGDKIVQAHRLSFVLHHGSISDKLSVCHSCDNPLCVNPKHLFIGTQSDNLNDALKKGRIKNAKIDMAEKFKEALEDRGIVSIKHLAKIHTVPYHTAKRIARKDSYNY